MIKTNMPLQWAKDFLSASVRNVFEDTTLTGAIEIRWTREGREVAYGLFCRAQTEILSTYAVSVNETKQYQATWFHDQEAKSLQELGKPGNYIKGNHDDPPTANPIVKISTSADFGRFNVQVWVTGSGIVWGESYATREKGRSAANEWLDASEYKDLQRIQETQSAR